MQAMKSPNGGRGYLAGAMDNAIKRGYRQAIADNAELWARVPSGGYTCPWCVMLASRGFVYRSKASAGGMHRFHAFCDCIAVPAKDLNSAHLDGYDPDKLYELYQKGEGIGTQPRKKMAYGTDGRDITSTGVKPMTREAAAKGTNPDYAKSDAFKLNCGNCSATYEMRRRGFDVEAKPMRGMRIGDWKVLFEKAVTHQFVPERGKTILEALSVQITRLYESGARGSVFVQWKGRKMGHFFSWEIENGVVKYIDSQNGLLDVSDYFTKVRPDSILHVRWDNLEPSNKGKDAYTDKG